MDDAHDRHSISGNTRRAGMGSITKRNHYNPCLWTALWNAGHFAAIRAGEKTGVPRKRVVHVLNVRSRSIYESAVERVHFDAGIGVANITPEGAIAFCRRNFPGQLEQLQEHIRTHPDEKVFVDFEDVLSRVEVIARYRSLIDIARRGGFGSPQQRGFLTGWFAIHMMRSHEMMQNALFLSAHSDIAMFEYFYHLKNAWGSALFLARATTPLAMGRWKLYRTPTDRFPLCDSPIMIGKHGIMVTLSPRLLVEIDLNARGTETEEQIVDGISMSKFSEFRRRAIGNTFKEIIFSAPDELERWNKHRDFKNRSDLLRTEQGRLRAIHDGVERVMWATLGFGRVPSDFEEWAGPLLGAPDNTPNPAT